MTLEEFRAELRKIGRSAELLDFTKRNLLCGMPFVFRGRDREFADFKERLCKKFGVEHSQILVVGSAKLGFSPQKGTEFSLDSDVDLAIVSESFFDYTSSIAAELEFQIRSQRAFLRETHWQKYHKYLRYLLIGWMRPDLLPRVGPCIEFQDDWFAFFEGLSFGKSEVGDYKVSAGVYRSQYDLERYSVESMTKVRSSLLMGDAV